MSQQGKPREFRAFMQHGVDLKSGEKMQCLEVITPRILPEESGTILTLVEKSELDIAVAALKFYADKNNHTIRRGGESDTRMRLDKGSTAREALKTLGVEV